MKVHPCTAPFLLLSLWAGCFRPQEVSLERELKFVLTRDGYRTFLRHFEKRGAVETKNQQNYYFDVEGYLIKRHGISIRLRTRGETVTMELDRTVFPRDHVGYELENEERAKAMEEAGVLDGLLRDGVLEATPESAP